MAPTSIGYLAHERRRELELKADRARRVAQARAIYRGSRRDLIRQFLAFKIVEGGSDRFTPLHRSLRRGYRLSLPPTSPQSISCELGSLRSHKTGTRKIPMSLSSPVSQY